MENYLEIIFKNSDKTVLYEGDSYLKKNLSDSMLITRKSIKIRFYRSKKINYVDVLESDNSLIRYQLQKALCFYLITQGSFPDVKSVVVFDGLEKHVLSEVFFTKNMKGCYLDICLSPEVASVIFGDSNYAKNIYIAITYMIKAQIDTFSNDCFRAAWSGINSIYNCLRHSKEYDDGVRESDLLKLLEKMIQKSQMENSIIEIEDLHDDFYNRLDWYNYSIKYGDDIETNHIKDSMILKHLVKRYKIKDEHDKAEIQLYNKAKKYSEKNVVDYKARLAMLVCRYCYMLRNRMFHGIKAYPVFVISEKAELTVEKKLTRILLTTISDLMVSLYIEGNT